MAIVMCSCNLEQIKNERDSAVKEVATLTKLCSEQQSTIDSLLLVTLKSDLLRVYGKKIVSKYESYTTHYEVDYNGNRKYTNFEHYANREKAFFYCEQLKKLNGHIDFSVKAKCINELDWEIDTDQIKFLKKIYRLYKLYGYDGVEAINEWQPIDEVERLILKRWDNRPYGEGGDSDFIKSIVNKYY
jgi:hypothetical protein